MANYILLTRFGGFGDLVMMEPTIEALAHKYPDFRIIVRTYTDYKDLFAYHPLVHKVVLDYNSFRLGFNYTDIKKYPGPGVVVAGETAGLPFKVGDFVISINLQGVIENTRVHGLDAFAYQADVVLKRRQPVIPWPGIWDNAPRGVVIQLRNRPQEHPQRNFTAEQALKILPTVMNDMKNRVLEEGLPFEEYMRLIGGAEIFIGPDSSGLHLAAAMGVKKIIGIYSPDYPPATRAYSNVYWVMNDEHLAKNLARAYDIVSREELYPSYLNVGDATSWVRNKALQYCRGHGLDVGADKWPFPGATPSTELAPQFQQAPFDFIYSSHCLEHIEDPWSELTKWGSCIRQDGWLFLYLPHPAMRKWRPGAEWCGPWHKWSPEPLTLVQWLQNSNLFNVVEYDPGPDSYWSFWIAARRL